MRVFTDEEITTSLASINKQIMGRASPWIDLPYALAHTPPTSPWPPLPWLVKKVLGPHVFGRKYAG